MLWNPAKPNDKNRKTKVKIEKLIFKLRCCRHRKKVREEGLVQRSEVEVIGKKQEKKWRSKANTKEERRQRKKEEGGKQEKREKTPRAGKGEKEK